MIDSSIAMTLLNALLAPPPNDPFSRIAEYLSVDLFWSIYVGLVVAGLAMFILAVWTDIRKRRPTPPPQPDHRPGFKIITSMPIDREQKP